MKQLISILLIFVCLTSYAQYNPRKAKQDNWIRLGLFTGSIVLNAVGDGLNDSGNKDWGHICNAASIGLTLSVPLFIDVEKDKWYWYLLEYTFIRFAVFDYSYNLTRGLPLEYHGTSNYYDRIWGEQQSLLLTKSAFLTIGIAINFTQFK